MNIFSKKNNNNFKIIILDDNFIIRHVLKLVLSSLASETGINIELFTSENGVEGLGFVYVTNPDLIIIDTTLPKYSGRELIDFLISNEKYKERQIILDDDAIPLDMHEGFLMILKKSRATLVKEMQEVVLQEYFSSRGLQVGELQPSFAQRVRTTLASKIIFWAMIIDKIRATKPARSFFIARIIKKDSCSYLTPAG